MWIVLSYTGSCLMVIAFCYSFQGSPELWLLPSFIVGFSTSFWWIATLYCFTTVNIFRSDNESIRRLCEDAPFISRFIGVALYIGVVLIFLVTACYVIWDVVTSSAYTLLWMSRGFSLTGSTFFWESGRLVHSQVKS